eukprot:359498-Chlamydomonas_euryale.AAC.6
MRPLQHGPQGLRFRVVPGPSLLALLFPLALVCSGSHRSHGGDGGGVGLSMRWRNCARTRATSSHSASSAMSSRWHSSSSRSKGPPLPLAARTVSGCSKSARSMSTLTLPGCKASYTANQQVPSTLGAFTGQSSSSRTASARPLSTACTNAWHPWQSARGA